MRKNENKKVFKQWLGMEEPFDVTRHDERLQTNHFLSIWTSSVSGWERAAQSGPDRLHLRAPPSEVTCAATNLCRLMTGGCRVTGAAYAPPWIIQPPPSRSISTSLREVWGPLASPLSAASSCSASAELSVTPARRPDGWRRALGQSCSAATEPQIEAFCRSTGVPGSPPRSLPKFWLIPSAPADNLPSHLAFIQTPPSNQRAAAAFSSLSLTGFQYEKVIWQRGLFWINHPAPFPPIPSFFPSFLFFFFFALGLDYRAMEWPLLNSWETEINKWSKFSLDCLWGLFSIRRVNGFVCSLEIQRGLLKFWVNFICKQIIFLLHLHCSLALLSINQWTVLGLFGWFGLWTLTSK